MPTHAAPPAALGTPGQPEQHQAAVRNDPGARSPLLNSLAHRGTHHPPPSSVIQLRRVSQTSYNVLASGAPLPSEPGQPVRLRCKRAPRIPCCRVLTLSRRALYPAGLLCGQRGVRFSANHRPEPHQRGVARPLPLRRRPVRRQAQRGGLHEPGGQAALPAGGAGCCGAAGAPPRRPLLPGMAAGAPLLRAAGAVRGRLAGGRATGAAPRGAPPRERPLAPRHRDCRRPGPLPPPRRAPPGRQARQRVPGRGRQR